MEPDDADLSIESEGYPLEFWVAVALTVVIAIAVWYKAYLMRAVWCPSQERLDGKTVLLTGGNSGIGKATAMELAKRGASLMLASRDVAASTKVAKEITAETGNSNIVVYHLDLASTQSIRQFAAEIIQSDHEVHVLINNAGTYCQTYVLTEDYIEKTLAVNYLGPFLLTRLLLPVLEASAPSRVINVAAHTHVFGRIHIDDLQLTKAYSSFAAYCQSKLALIMFTRSLAEHIQEQGITTYAVHPGITLTPMHHNNNPLKKHLLKWFCRKPREGAQTTLYCAVAKELDKNTGGYYSNCAPSTPMNLAFDENMVQQLWEASEELVGLPPLTDLHSSTLEELD